MNMNLNRHVDAFRKLYHHLVEGEEAQAAQIKDFYEEYFAMADLPAEFYLETVRTVFQEHALPLGKLTYRERVVDPRAIRRTALFTIEGEKDDICAVGQTVAAQEMCSSIRPYMRMHHVQTAVGHYGSSTAGAGTTKSIRACGISLICITGELDAVACV
jgi:polyhydroxyalkanoate depolymerase